jgi:hypothetical protein
VAGYSVYNWKVAVADIDGSGKNGLYSYLIFVDDNNGANLGTPHKGYFQLYQAYDYDVWASRMIDSLQFALDSLQAIIAGTGGSGVNVRFVSTDATAADNFETMLDGTGGQQLTLAKLKIRNTAAGDSAISVSSNANGSIAAAFFTEGAVNSGPVFVIENNSNAGNALQIASGASGAIVLSGVNNFFTLEDHLDKLRDTANQMPQLLWNEPRVGNTTDGTFGKFLDTTISSRATAAGSGLDSATTSRMLHRIAWARHRVAVATLQL